MWGVVTTGERRQIRWYLSVRSTFQEEWGMNKEEWHYCTMYCTIMYNCIVQYCICWLKWILILWGWWWWYTRWNNITYDFDRSWEKISRTQFWEQIWSYCTGCTVYIYRIWTVNILQQIPDHLQMERINTVFTSLRQTS